MIRRTGISVTEGRALLDFSKQVPQEVPQEVPQLFQNFCGNFRGTCVELQWKWAELRSCQLYIYITAAGACLADLSCAGAEGGSRPRRS